MLITLIINFGGETLEITSGFTNLSETLDETRFRVVNGFFNTKKSWFFDTEQGTNYGDLYRTVLTDTKVFETQTYFDQALSEINSLGLGTYTVNITRDLNTLRIVINRVE